MHLVFLTILACAVITPQAQADVSPDYGGTTGAYNNSPCIDNDNGQGACAVEDGRK